MIFSLDKVNKPLLSVMKMGKRGLSDIVSTGLLILLAIAGVIIIWGVARTFFIGTGENINTDVFTSSFNIPADKVKIDRGIKYVSFSLKRGAGKADITGLKIVLEDSEGTSAVFNISSLNELESKVIDLSYADTSLKDLAKISAAPVLEGANGKEMQAGIVGDYKLENRAYPMPSGLVGYWGFDANSGNIAVDSSENGNNGIVKGGAIWVAGKINNALDFNSSDYVEIPDSPNLDISDDITISLWLYPKSDFSGYAGWPVNKWGGINDADYVLYYFGVGSGENRNIQFLANIGGEWMRVSPGYTASLNQWQNVAFKRNSTGGYLYVNGAPQGTYTALSGSFMVNDVALKIGFIDGSIDEVRVYNRDLSDAEIKALYAYNG